MIVGCRICPGQVMTRVLPIVLSAWVVFEMVPPFDPKRLGVVQYVASRKDVKPV